VNDVMHLPGSVVGLGVGPIVGVRERAWSGCEPNSARSQVKTRSLGPAQNRAARGLDLLSKNGTLKILIR
jgi:hypothetical protein